MTKPRLSSFRNSAQKMVTEPNAVALTTTSDPDWKFPGIDLLNQKYPPIDYGVSCWRPTNIQRIIAYYNMPGAKPNYIYKKKNKDVKIEDSDEDNSSQTSLPISTLNINDDNDSDNSTD